MRLNYQVDSCDSCPLMEGHMRDSICNILSRMHEDEDQYTIRDAHRVLDNCPLKGGSVTVSLKS